MWFFKPLFGNGISGLRASAMIATGCAGLLLSGCTVEPLNASRPDSQVAAGTETGTTGAILATIDVDPVKTRTAQQVRNNLLFSMNGGNLQAGGSYKAVIGVKSITSNLNVEVSSLAPTSAKVTITSTYQLVDRSSGKTVASGRRRVVSTYDRSSQSFGNERAERDAQNRAARELAEQLRLAIAQDVAGL